MGQDFTKPPKQPSGVNSIRICEKRDGFVVGTNKGIKAYFMEPVQHMYTLEKREVGAISTAELMGNSKLCAFTCVKDDGPFKENEVRLVNPDFKVITGIASYKSDVLSIRMAVPRDPSDSLYPDTKLVVVLHDEISIRLLRYESKVPLLQLLKTGPNPKGLCELSRNKIMVCPAPNIGQVQIVDLNQITEESTATPIIIKAHDSEIACLAISISGAFIATASKKGTIMRVFRTSSKNQELELRRGCDTAVIYSISFSPCDKYVAMCSDKGTVHIFAVKDPSMNHTNIVHHVGNLLPINLGKSFEEQKSLAQFTIEDECPCVISLIDHQTIVAITMDGDYLKYMFTPQGHCRLRISEYYLTKGLDFPLKNAATLPYITEWFKQNPANRKEYEAEMKRNELERRAIAGKAKGEESVRKNEDEHETESEGGESADKSQEDLFPGWSEEFGKSARHENPERNEGDGPFRKEAKDENAVGEQDGVRVGGEDVGEGEQVGKSMGEDVRKVEEGEEFGKNTCEDVGKDEEGEKSADESVGKTEKSEQFGESRSDNVQK